MVRARVSAACIGGGGINGFVLEETAWVDAKDLTSAANRVAPGVGSLPCIARSETLWTGVALSSGEGVRS